MLMYNLPIFMDGDATAFLSGLARANGLIKKVRRISCSGHSTFLLKPYPTERESGPDRCRPHRPPGLE